MLFAKYTFPLLVSLVSISLAKPPKPTKGGSFPSLSIPESFTLSGTYGYPYVDKAGNPALSTLYQANYSIEAPGYIAVDSISNSIA